MSSTALMKSDATETQPVRLLPCPFCGARNMRARIHNPLLLVYCLTCGAPYRLPLEAITSDAPRLHALVCDLLSMLRHGQLAPGFSNDDWLAWLAKARHAVQ